MNINIEIDEELHSKFKSKVALEKTTIRDKILGLMKGYINEKHSPNR